jgi:outer membrane protein
MDELKNKNMLKYFSSLLIFTALHLRGQDTVVYSLKRCIDIAIKNNLNVKLAEYQMENNEARLQQSRAANLPYLSGYAQQGINTGKSINPFTNTFINKQILTGQYGLNGGLTLFNGFSSYNLMRQSAYIYQAGKMDYEQARIDLTMNVMLAYLQILSNEEQFNQAKSQVEVTKVQIDRLMVLEKNNAISPAVLYDTKGQLANDKLSFINAKTSLATSKISLAQLMNLNFTPNVKFEKIDISNELKAFDNSNDNIYAEASKNFPAIKASEFRRMSAAKNVQSARGQLFPTLTLNGSIGTNYSGAALSQKVIGVIDAGTDNYVTVNNLQIPVYAPQYIFSNDKIQFNNQFKNNLNSYIGVSLQFNIFNSLRSKTQLKIAKVNKQQAETQKQYASTNLRSTINQAYIDMNASFERFNILQDQVNNYAASFKIATLKFEKGALSTVEYVIAKSNVDKANMNLIAAKFDYILKCKILDYYTGKILF